MIGNSKKLENFGAVLPALTLCLLWSSFGGPFAFEDSAAVARAAENRDKTATPGLSRALRAFEQRFFFHEYEQDPLPKRLERLELLIFGSCMGGSDASRFENLQKAIALRDAESVDMMKKLHAGKDDSSSSDAGQKQDYPVLTTLEWRMLKKTYRDETLDQRLERLESELFGKPSPAMSYLDRIERLKKIAGLVEPPSVAQNSPSTGPLPRADARDGNEEVFPFKRAPFPRGFQPGTTFEQDLARQAQRDMAQILNFMDKSFPDFFKNNKIFPGLEMSPGFEISPSKPPGGNDRFTMPITPKRKPIPPYADPNSI